ncbi:MAG: hypothetical protein AAGE43_11430 [Pseudomonadota bacterium]
MKILQWILGIVFGLLILIGLVIFGARFADGPVVMLPGGPFESGEMRASPEDWGFAAAIEEIEFESGGRSRTAWIVVDGGDAFIPASTAFPPGKRWHKDALVDPAAVVRIDGVRYPVALTRVAPESPRFTEVLSKLAEKYPALPGSEEGDPAEAAWLFELRERAMQLSD